MTRQLTLQDYIAMARRRKWLLIAPPLMFALLAFAMSFLINVRYTSQTLVLVEGQKVSDTLVKPAVAEDLNQRLSTMKEQILSRSRLEPIMQKFGLYKDQSKRVSTEDLIDEMRKQIVVTPIRGANDSTPGFYISFTADNPKLAQDVCAEITSLFMEQNLKLREERAVGTTDFLASQLAESKRNLDEQDAKLAAFEQKYIGQLPGQEQLNINMLTTLKAQLDGVTQSLNRAQQDKLYTENLLAQETAKLQSSQNGGEAVSPSQVHDQLSKLREELADLQTRYTPEYPDVIKTKARIAKLEKSFEDGAKRQTPASASPGPVPEAISSPAIQRLRDNIHLLNETIREQSSEQAKLQQSIKQYERRVQLSPTVEQQYKQLTRDYQTAQAFYDDLLKKKAQSEMATNLERQQQGEQFRVVDPANLPEKPSYPRRPVFAAMGFVAGLGLGVGLAFLLEMLREAIRSESDVEFYLKVSVFGSIPEMNLSEKPGSDSVKRKNQPQRREINAPHREFVEEKFAVKGR